MPWAVKVGKSTSSCHRKKSHAKRRAKALRAMGRKKVRISKRKSCG